MWSEVGQIVCSDFPALAENPHGRGPFILSLPPLSMVLHSRGQGATEYLVILGTVLLSAVIIASMASSSVSTASAKEQQSSAYWQAASPFSIGKYSLGPGVLVVALKNQLSEKVKLTGIDVGDGSSAVSVFSGSEIFGSGEQKTLFLQYGGSNACRTLAAGAEYELANVVFTYDKSSAIAGLKQVGVKPLVGRCAASSAIQFVPPTPNDASSVSAGSNITLNATVSGVSLIGLGLRWNASDYSFYDSSLILMADFDNVSALGENDSRVADLSSTGANGFVSNAAYADGKYGKALNFSRQGSVNFSSPAQLSPSNELTVEAWVKKNAAYSIQNISAGNEYSCVLLSNGSVLCWGYNVYGQLGIGNTTNMYSPVFVNGITTATAISLGGSNACALLSNGSVMCWGSNDYGQLGIGNTTNMYSPVFVNGISTAIAVSTSNSGWHTCAVLSNHSVLCWGYNTRGGLGNGNTTKMYSPVFVIGLTTAVAVATGNSHSCALLANNTMMCWGDNFDGALGIGSTTNSYVPVFVPGITTAAAISTGYGTTFSVLSNGSVLCWGYNDYGELGIGNTTTMLSPTLISSLNATKVVTSHQDSCALLSNGSAACWGRNYGSSPGLVNLTKNASSIATGSGSFTCAVLTSGGAYCGGSNIYGQLGNSITEFQVAPVLLDGDFFAKASCSLDSCCRLLVNGSVACSGSGAYWALGNANTASTAVPLLVSGLPVASSVSTTMYSSYALLSNGSVASWGNNSYGQLGDGTTTNRSSPVLVSGLQNVQSLATSNALSHFCAVLLNGSVACWGSNSYGQLGIGNTTDMYSPVFVQGVSTAAAVSTGAYSSCAVLSNGSVLCWGANSNGQLGIGNTTNMYSPVFVQGVSTAAAISIGRMHSCAVLSNGSVLCWGQNAYGTLGIGNTTKMYSPVLVQGLTNITTLSSSVFTQFAAKMDGTTYGWGRNANGLMGIGVPTSDKWVPIPVSDGIAAGRGANSWKIGYTFGDNSEVYGSANTAFVYGNLTTGWNHVVMTYDKSHLKLYVNGVLSNRTALGLPIFNDGDFQVGANSNSSVDSLRVYNRALSASEVAQHYNSNLRKTGADSWLFTSNQNLLPAATYSYFVNGTASGAGRIYSEERTIRVA